MGEGCCTWFFKVSVGFIMETWFFVFTILKILFLEGSLAFLDFYRRMKSAIKVRIVARIVLLSRIKLIYFRWLNIKHYIVFIERKKEKLKYNKIK